MDGQTSGRDSADAVGVLGCGPELGAIGEQISGHDSAGCGGVLGCGRERGAMDGQTSGRDSADAVGVLRCGRERGAMDGQTSGHDSADAVGVLGCGPKRGAMDGQSSGLDSADSWGVLGCGPERDAMDGQSSGLDSADSGSPTSGQRPTQHEPRMNCKPPCADGELELVEIHSPRFEELRQAGYLCDQWDWENRKLLFNPRARKATVAQRREILRRDGYCCRTPGCPHRMWLQLHHTVYFSRHGKTVRANLVPLCFRCHSNVHQGLLKIRGNADGTLTFTDAQGLDLGSAYALGVADWLNFWVGWTGGEFARHLPRTG